VLIVRLSAIGDVIHTLPALSLLRERLPEARIGWVVEPAAASLLDKVAGLNDLFVWPRKKWAREGRLGAWQNTRALRREIRGALHDPIQLETPRWGLALDVQGNLRSGWTSWRSGARRRVGFRGAESREGNGVFMTEAHRPPPALAHVIEKNVYLAAAAIGAADIVDEATKDIDSFRARVSALWRRPVLAPFEDARARLQKILSNDTRKLIVLSPGGAWESKRWPAERFGELVARLAATHAAQVRVAIAYAPDEQPLAEKIRAIALASSNVPASIFAGLPPTTLPEVAVLCRRAALFVAGDTGALHLAAHHGVPCVALYGGSDPARNGPYSTPARILDAQADSAVRRHYRHDPVGLSPLTVDAVLDAVRSSIARSASY
jgi:lipopolysaccharide heptosyltransferase I